MKTGLILTISLLAFNFLSFAQKSKAKKDMKKWRYEVQAVQQGHEGTYLVKVWSYSKKPKIAIEQSKKNAVHGIIFRGVTASGRVPSQRPLTKNPNLEMEKIEFFNDFFADGGKYMKFVNLTGDGSVSARDRIKVGREYKVGVVVSVNVAALRKDLESAGILKSLSSGF